MKLIKSCNKSSILVTGAFRGLVGGWESVIGFSNVSENQLIYSDWDCSVFITRSDSNTHLIICGHKYQNFVSEEIHSVCSTKNYLYIISLNKILFIDKNNGQLSSHNLSNISQMVTDGTNVYCLQDERIFLLKHDELALSIKPIEYPSKIPMKIKSIACGDGFLLCLTLTGQVYSQGLGSRGQLGLGDLDNREELTLIEALETLTVIRIAAGKWHSCCLTDSGDVYTWGWNEYGQLGHKSLSIRKKSSACSEDYLKDCVSVLALPKPVEFPNEELISEIACGARHTVCLSENGLLLFSFGWNKYGQLGLDSNIKIVDEPILIRSLKVKYPHSHILSVWCGLWSTSLLTTDKSSQYSKYVL